MDNITWNADQIISGGDYSWTLPTWSIADSTVADFTVVGNVSDYIKGYVTGVLIQPKKLGETTITWSANDGTGKSASIKIRVCSEVAETLNANERNTVTIKGIGKTYQLKPTVTYTSGKTDSQVTYQILNKKVATVSSSGVITAVGEGSTSVVITAIYGNDPNGQELFKRSVAVKVEKADQSTDDKKDDGKTDQTDDKKDDGKTDQTDDKKDDGKSDTTDDKGGTNTTKPKKVKNLALKSKKKGQLQITWKKDSKVSGYEILLATNKKFTKNKKKITVKSYKTKSAIVKKLKSKKTYYVKIRSYKKVNGKKVYGAYSKAIKLKVK